MGRHVFMGTANRPNESGGKKEDGSEDSVAWIGDLDADGGGRHGSRGGIRAGGCGRICRENPEPSDRELGIAHRRRAEWSVRLRFRLELQQPARRHSVDRRPRVVSHVIGCKVPRAREQAWWPSDLTVAATAR